MPTILGLPIHPLVVHAVVVLLPLAALSGVLVAVRPRLRAKYGLLVGVLNVAAAAAVPLAMLSGTWLYDHRVDNLVEKPCACSEPSLIEEHKDIAFTLWPFALVLLVGVLFVLLLPAFGRRYRWANRWQKSLALLAIVITLVGAGTTLDRVFEIGKAGAEAAWSNR